MALNPVNAGPTVFYAAKETGKLNENVQAHTSLSNCALPVLFSEEAGVPPPPSPLRDDFEKVKKGLLAARVRQVFFDRDQLPIEILDGLFTEAASASQWRESTLCGESLMEKCLASGQISTLMEHKEGINKFLNGRGWPAVQICENPEFDLCVKLYLIWRVPKNLWHTQVAPLCEEYSKQPQCRIALQNEMNEALWGLEDQTTIFQA